MYEGISTDEQGVTLIIFRTALRLQLIYSCLKLASYWTNQSKVSLLRAGFAFFNFCRSESFGTSQRSEKVQPDIFWTVIDKFIKLFHTIILTPTLKSFPSCSFSTVRIYLILLKPTDIQEKQTASHLWTRSQPVWLSHSDKFLICGESSWSFER